MMINNLPGKFFLLQLLALNRRILCLGLLCFHFIAAASLSEGEELSDSSSSTYIFQQNLIILNEGATLIIAPVKEVPTNVAKKDLAQKKTVDIIKVDSTRHQTKVPKKPAPKTPNFAEKKISVLPSSIALGNTSSNDCAVSLSFDSRNFDFINPEKRYFQISTLTVQQDPITEMRFPNFFSIYPSSLRVRPPPTVV